MAVRLLGIRHHGPGSARAVEAALAGAPPDIVLIEGPADAEAVLPLAADIDMRPPVALLGYVIDRPERAVFSPFASFSPEWVALTWALRAGVPVRFIDLPVKVSLAERPHGEQLALTDETRPTDPIADLADAAGYDDPERWWEDVVEHQHGSDPFDPFDAIAHAMTVLRARHEPSGQPDDPDERRREAHMRQAVRAARNDGHQDIVVVCGAWHVPALARVDEPSDATLAKADVATLRGMPKVKAAVTWVPWTHRRLATATGYGAGVTAPGWYHHLHRHGGPDVIARWFAEAARVLRAADHPASAADVVEATRLASALAVLRGRPLAGLTEVDDAARAALGQGHDTVMRLLSNELVVGTEIGEVPASTPMVPLARSLAAEQKKCRLRPEGTAKVLELDLRQPMHLARSRLLHRLTLLGVPWGREAEGRRSAGTFRETWQLRWEPEHEVRIIEVSGLGTTVATAAVAAVVQQAQQSSDAGGLGELTTLLERALLAGLDDAVPPLLAMVGDRAAVATDVARLMEALPPLARTIRYGDVRGTDSEALHQVTAGIVSRVCAGLAPACTGLDDDGSAAMAALVRDTQAALSLLGAADQLTAYHRALGEVAERDRVHGVVQGLATRLLADAGVLDPDRTERRLSRSLSAGTPAIEAAAFVEGFLGGSGTVLVHDPLLLGVIDRWLATLHAEAFTQTLPLLRRTFGSFEAAERRAIGDRVRTGEAPATHRVELGLDPERVAMALATVGSLLGVDR